MDSKLIKAFRIGKQLLNTAQELLEEHKDECISTAETMLNKAKATGMEAGSKISEFWEANKDDALKTIKSGQDITSELIDKAIDKAKDAAIGIRYSEEYIRRLQEDIEHQGAAYREQNRINQEKQSFKDSIMLGGETLAALLMATELPDDILKAYETAYPNLANEISFADKVNELDSDALSGFISGVKGKLFEMKYVDYLNDGNLPDGYSAFLAESPTQAGWDIGIKGANGELASVIQAKATDSLSYVKDAMEEYPSIDFVTTDEVYSQLVLNGIGENIASGGILNEDLISAMNEAVESASISFDFNPPLLTLAFIAFTSYKDNNLTLFEKAQHAGDRASKAYMGYLIGNGLAVATNTWWIGVIGSAGSRLIADRLERRVQLYKKLEKVYQTNRIILKRMKYNPQPNYAEIL
jgi:hypothetical protein